MRQTATDIEREQVTKYVAAVQDKIAALVEPMRPLETQALYQLLWGQGHRIPTNLTAELRKLARAEMKNG